MPQQQVFNQPDVIFDDRVTSGISLEIFTAFHAVPRRGAEAGGILLGRRSGERILVEDFEPVLCEHRFGPSYILSDEDLRGLEESVEWFRTPGAGLQVLGFYRSQTRPNSSIDDRDNELIRRFSPEPGSVFLLVRPSRNQTTTSELFVFAEGRLRRAASESSVPSELSASTELSRALIPADVPPAHTDEPRHTEEPRPAGKVARVTWGWVAAVAAMTIAAAIVGYRSVDPPNGTGTPTDISRASSPSDAPPVQADLSPTLPPSAVTKAADTSPKPAITPEIERGVREAMAQWERAVRSGDPNLIAACYSSQLDMTARRAAVQSEARYGRPAILRISDLTLIPISETSAAAVFRKHWQSSGPRIFAGEEQERLTFVNGADGWKIASEEETKIYWMQRPRG